MNKRITSLTLVFVMIMSLLATAVPALAAPASTCTYTIEADKTSANPGDTINFTIYMQQTGTQTCMEGTLVIPDGLTFVENSGVLADGIKTTLGWDAVDWTPDPNMILNGYGSEDFTGEEKIALMKFQCTVNNDATAKDYEVKLIDLVADGGSTENYETKNPTCVPAVVTVAAAPVAVTGVTIDETLSVNIGQTKTPSFTVAPAEATNKTVSFTSDNTAVATVNATTGAVTGVSKGTATITVKTADGNFTDTCTVTVSCAHTNKSTVPAQNSTCTVKGWDEYKECDDCGQLFDTSDVEINEVPFLNLADHTGGTATCTTKAVCSVCHQSYGNYANHSYTAETKKSEALKTAGNCRDKAVYYYSCSVCGNVEHNDAHTFEGDKDANTHVGGTSTVNASEPDHKNQVDGYTGDTKCLGCGEIIATGTSIPAGAHTPSSTWNSDGTYHWKECTTMGCGVVIDGSKAEHSSTGANVATCQHKAVCDVCNVEYGALAAHNPASGWTSDASGHWHACQTAGCTEKCDFASHTPDHTGHATEEYAIKCTECGYVIEAQLGHTHVFNKEVATDAYKASDATCTAKATYYHSCVCGAKGTTTFEYGELGAHNWAPATCTAPKTCSVCQATEGDPLGHTEGTEWKSDKDNHWHTCTVAGCGVVIDSSKAAHTPDRSEPTYDDAVKCAICGYVITPALSNPTVTLTVPFTKTVKQCGNVAPGTKTFALEVFEIGNSNESEYPDVTVTATVTTNGKGVYEGTFTISGPERQIAAFVSEGFFVREKNDNAANWTYSDAVWFVAYEQVNDTGNTTPGTIPSEPEYALVPYAATVDDSGAASYVPASTSSDKMTFENTYTENKTNTDPTDPTDPVEPTDPSKPEEPIKPTESNPDTGASDSPQTGDNSMMALWIALLFVSGFGVVTTTVYGKKRKSVK